MSKFPERNNGTHRLMMNAKLNPQDYTDIRNQIKKHEGIISELKDTLKKVNNIVERYYSNETNRM